MEKLPNLIDRALQQAQSNSLPQLLTGSQEGKEISIYKGELTPTCLSQEVLKVCASFPSLPAEFFDILSERVAANKFNDARLKAAVANLLDNFTYNTPKIADIISFDRKVKLFSYNEMLVHCHNTGNAYSDYTMIKRNGKKYWIRKSEKDQYNLPNEL
jgi:hypothetical protein